MKNNPLLFFEMVIGIAAILITIAALNKETPPNIIVEHPVETVEFIYNADFNESTVFIKTDRENLLIDTYNISFMEGDANTSLTLEEIEFGSLRNALKASAYNLHIPANQVDKLNIAHIKTFG